MYWKYFVDVYRVNREKSKPRSRKKKKLNIWLVSLYKWGFGGGRLWCFGCRARGSSLTLEGVFLV